MNLGEFVYRVDLLRWQMYRWEYCDIVLELLEKMGRGKGCVGASRRRRRYVVFP
jgi:hypothetical protein